jgi:hypothetical protein
VKTVPPTDPLTSASMIRAQSQYTAGTPGAVEPSSSAVERFCTQQCGLITWTQLRRARMTRAAVRWRLTAGRWQQPLPGVYYTSPGALSWDVKVHAAYLYAGLPAQMSGSAALRRRGVAAGSLGECAVVLIPHARQVRSHSFVQVCRTRRFDPRAVVIDGIVTCTVERAIADAARWTHDAVAVVEVIIDAHAQGLVTLSLLRAELDSGSKRYNTTLRAAINELSAI